MKLFKYLSFICSCLMICVGASYATQCSYEGSLTTCKLNHPIYKKIQFNTAKHRISLIAYCGHQYMMPKENITLPQIEGEFWTDAQHLAQFFTNHAWVKIKNIQSSKANAIKIGIEIHLKQMGGMHECGQPGCPGHQDSTEQCPMNQAHCPNACGMAACHGGPDCSMNQAHCPKACGMPECHGGAECPKNQI